MPESGRRWVVDAVKAHTSRNKKCQFPGYTLAYMLSVLRHFHNLFEVWPLAGEVAKIMGYCQQNKVARAFKRLEDEGYVKLDPSRCRVIDILREPYFVQRPAFASERINELERRLVPPPALPETGEDR